MSAVAELAHGGVYLRMCLAPLAEVLARPDVTDVYINRPGELWLETLDGNIQRIEDGDLTGPVLERLARQIAALTHQGVSREHPLLAAAMPDGSRVQIVAPPATRGPIALAIRRQISAGMTLRDYEAASHFANTGTKSGGREEAEIAELISGRKFAQGLALAVQARKNIVVAGGTSTGKTTFLNALLREVPADERLILIEDTPELITSHENSVGLVCVRGALGEAKVTANDLVSAALRMRPDRIIVGELRGPEAFAFLRAVASGHPGSMTTIHADSPEAAVEQLVMLVLHGGTKLGRSDVRAFVEQSIDIFVQLSRVDGRRRIDCVKLCRRGLT